MVRAVPLGVGASASRNEWVALVRRGCIHAVHLRFMSGLDALVYI